jgi:ribonuclease R
VTKKTDPYAKRESKKYTNPIASREFILDILDQSVGPMSHKQLVKALGIKDDDDREALRRRLLAMERDGQIHSNRKQAYAKVDKLDLIRGRVQGHRDGYGFLIPVDGDEDIYLASRQMRKVFDGDEVLVRLSPTGVRGRRDGAIVEVVSHNTQQLVGRYFHEQGVGFVRPENIRQGHDVLVAPEHTNGAESGQFVMVEITRQPSRNAMPMGRVIEVLGNHMAPGMEIDVAIRAHDIPHEWPSAVSSEAAQLPVEVAEADKKHRVDLRDLPFVTIDGEDARDFDDAVYCEKKKSGGWRLYVAIADVSHYVNIGSALDNEAEVRGTSVYFPDFVVPMLPEALSNGLCSLNPNVDRLAMVCEMTISASGRISGYFFYEGLIHSHARLTYTQVGQMIDEREDAGSNIRHAWQHLLPHLDELHNLYQVLRQIREARGAIDFETTETRILFDKERKIERIIPVVRNDAHKLIEECMLCANVCAARFIEKHELDGLYRVHDGPREQKLENLRTFLGELGLNLRGKDQPEPAHYQSLLQKIANRPDAKIIQTVMLRSLSQAMYQPDNKGHFGLAYPAYTHFTSPIRRYPDLLVHRAIRHIVRSRQESSNVRRVKGAKVLAKKAIYPYSLEHMLAFGEQTSMTERRADEATRDVVSWLKCEYLQDHVGDVYQGVITGVTNFGVFVELLDVYVEGLVHITSLPSDYYHFEEAHHRLIGERTRRTFCLGDELTVQVSAVKLDERKVDFELVGDHSDSAGLIQKDSIRDKLRRGDFGGLDAKPKSKSGKKPTKKSASGKKAGGKTRTTARKSKSGSAGRKKKKR